MSALGENPRIVRDPRVQTALGSCPLDVCCVMPDLVKQRGEFVIEDSLAADEHF
jgi:hypothetical protein